MWLENIFELAIFCLGFLYLKQITTWTLPSFRQGIVIRRYQEPFSGKIPEELIKQEIICKNIIFKFDTPNRGLFRAYPKWVFLKSRRLNYLPSLLGEIKLSRNDIAQITLRVPLSLALIWLALFVALVLSNLESILITNSVVGVAKVIIVILIIGVFTYISFDFEKMDLHDSVKILDERANSDTL